MVGHKPPEPRWWRSPTRPGARPYLIVLAGDALIVAVLTPLRTHLGLLSIGLIFLLSVVLVATRWGWRPGLFATVITNLSLNFFFVPPLYTFTVQTPGNLLALGVFLGVTALTSATLARAHAGEMAALRLAEETTLLHEISHLIVVSADTEATLTTLCERVRSTFGVEVCAILLPSPAGLERAAFSGTIAAIPATGYEQHSAEEAFRHGSPVYMGGEGRRRRPRIVGVPDRRMPMAFIPLVLGERILGVMQLAGQIRARVFTSDEQRLLRAFADEAALAVDRHRLLQEATQAEALKVTDRLKSALLSAVSHDLRTPLTAILAASSGLLQEDIHWSDEDRHEFLVSIESQATRLSRLVTNLLDLSRIEGGALRAEASWCAVWPLLENALAALDGTPARHTVRLSVDAEVREVRCDPVQIPQVISNLLENAVKYAPAGAPIDLTVRQVDDELEVAVSDQGPGIRAEERDHIFAPFYRLPATRRMPGAGIGLMVCKGMVEAHGGRIWVEDRPGGGARFVFRIPLSGPTPHRPAGGTMGTAGRDAVRQGHPVPQGTGAPDERSHGLGG